MSIAIFLTSCDKECLMEAESWSKFIIMETLNYYGIALGAVSFLIIGIFHPLVIKSEYYFGRNIWWIFFIVGIVASVLSLISENTFLSVTLGIFGFSSFWGIKEVFEQEQRVKKGRFPKNPKRNYD